MGLPALLAGAKRHLLTASTAAWSSAAWPLVSRTSTEVGSPFAATRTRSATVPSQPALRAAGG
jgi:hypothetical protein